MTDIEIASPLLSEAAKSILVNTLDNRLAFRRGHHAQETTFAHSGTYSEHCNINIRCHALDRSGSADFNSGCRLRGEECQN
ncbi:hypothetical protein KMZ93_19865 [Bradyrhizobium sediminis]|uniref:Uncharacterized protein n=1 Tax=Bradyrhizobium sediminis TaxID=2840469 RepID=A0A975RWK5_9BRAD|nr:hypothetical protein [Bradyrhizobium sediminis]QWG22213.1 hypothetical protein KMZ93_19865 [Bradyrhizobium sediminis]